MNGYPLAHNTEKNAQGVPVILEDPRGYPFAVGERESDWHEATDEEYQAFLDYWNEQDS
jgi:hypothetical protein